MQRYVSVTTMALAVLAPLIDLAALGLCAGSAAAQTITTYRWVDAQGVVHYSDTPQPGAQVIQQQSAQTYRAPPPPATSAAAAAPKEDPDAPYQACGVTQPASEASFFDPETVPVSVQLTPGVRPGDQIAVTVDGAALNPLAPDRLQYQVMAPVRGAHTLNVVVQDTNGKQVCHSSLTFYVQQPSLLSPTSPARGH
ncbi:MAG TPA: DUF4124 domain-containing protein [Steroidobacteraceae bacterium]|nr:DUF4124 domain-containing protein [Steroidobacteraceae bacterium]